MSGSTCHRMNTLNLYINRCRLSSNCPYFICIFHPPFWTHRINYKRFLMDRCYLKKKEWSKIQQKLEINLGVFFLFKQFWKDCSSSFVHHSEPFHLFNFIPFDLKLYSTIFSDQSRSFFCSNSSGKIVVALLFIILNPFTPKISLVIILSVFYTILMMLAWRIWYWINY